MSKLFEIQKASVSTQQKTTHKVQGKRILSLKIYYFGLLMLFCFYLGIFCIRSAMLC